MMEIGAKEMSNVYKQAGVDVEKGYEAVERMKKHIDKVRSVRRYRVFCRIIRINFFEI